MNSFVNGFGVIDLLDQAGCKLPNGTKRNIVLTQVFGQGYKKAGRLARLKSVIEDFRLIPRSRRPSQGCRPLRRR